MNQDQVTDADKPAADKLVNSPVQQVKDNATALTRHAAEKIQKTLITMHKTSWMRTTATTIRPDPAQNARRQQASMSGLVGGQLVFLQGGGLFTRLGFAVIPTAPGLLLKILLPPAARRQQCLLVSP